jgi:hypothetical protein
MTSRLLLGVTIAVLSFGDLRAQDAKKTEPTNAKEAAVKKAEADRVVNEKYAAMVAKVPADEQAWERVLQGNLGSFYLPIHKRQKVNGQSNAWDFVRDNPKLPRVLLIGDSVSRGYTQARQMFIGLPQIAVRRRPGSRSWVSGWGRAIGL